MSVHMNKDKVNDKHNTKILNIKQEFSGIKEMIRNAHNIFNNLHNKTNTLKKVYDKLLQQNKNNLYIFGLDSFKFQNKLINVEFETMNQYYCLISNRMFCDYFKLNQIVTNYIIEKIDDDKIKMRVKQQHGLKEKYDYINIYKFYDISKTSEVFNNVINMIVELVDYSSSLTKELDNYKSKKKNGFNINNFIYTFEYNNILLQQQISLYLNYVSFFLRLHKKYIIRFTNKIQLMYQQVNQDITFEDQNNYINEDEANENDMLKTMKLDTDSDSDSYSNKNSSNGSSPINGIEENVKIQIGTNVTDKMDMFTNPMHQIDDTIFEDGLTAFKPPIKDDNNDISKTQNILNLETENTETTLPNGESLFSMLPDNE